MTAKCQNEEEYSKLEQFENVFSSYKIMIVKICFIFIVLNSNKGV